MARFDPHQSYLLQPHPKRWKLQTILGIIVLGSAEPGADKDIWLPSAGPYDQRLGYAQLKSFLPELASAGFSIAAQARQSEGFRAIVGKGHFPIYREKSQAGLIILDRNDQPLYNSQYPRLQYADFDAIPPVLVEALLFIENRDLLARSVSAAAGPAAARWPRRSRSFAIRLAGARMTARTSITR